MQCWSQAVECFSIARMYTRSGYFLVNILNPHFLQIKEHVEAVHEGKKPFPCPHCDSRFGYKPQLKKHIESVHEKIKPFECDVCKARFTLKRSMKMHKDAVHDGVRAFQCTWCDMALTQGSRIVNFEISPRNTSFERFQ